MGTKWIRDCLNQGQGINDVFHRCNYALLKPFYYYLNVFLPFFLVNFCHFPGIIISCISIGGHIDFSINGLSTTNRLRSQRTQKPNKIKVNNSKLTDLEKESS